MKQTTERWSKKGATAKNWFIHTPYGQTSVLCHFPERGRLAFLERSAPNLPRERSAPERCPACPRSRSFLS